MTKQEHEFESHNQLLPLLTLSSYLNLWEILCVGGASPFSFLVKLGIRMSSSQCRYSKFGMYNAQTELNGFQAFLAFVLLKVILTWLLFLLFKNMYIYVFCSFEMLSFKKILGEINCFLKYLQNILKIK